MPSFSRQNSTTSLSSANPNSFNPNAFEPTTQWIESWLPDLPLHTILTLISQIPLPPTRNSTTDHPSPSILQTIQSSTVTSVEPSPIRIQYFEWSPLSLGWYESLLWSFAFISEMQVQRGTVGVWNGTNIRLFRVEAVAPVGPSLSSPRGAVDAVGTNIVERIGRVNLRGTGTVAAPNEGEARPERPQVSRTGTGDGRSFGLVRGAII